MRLVRRSIVLPVTACAVALLPSAAAASPPEDVRRLERALIELSRAKQRATDEVSAQRAEAHRALRRCRRRGRGWRRIRRVGHRPQRSLYARGARRLWRDLHEAALEGAALEALTPAFDRFLARFDRPLDDPVLQDGVNAFRKRMRYHRAATAFASCRTFERLLRPVRELPHRTHRQKVRLDYRGGRIYGRMTRFVPRRLRAAGRRHWPRGSDERLEAASNRMVELGGNEGRAAFLRFAHGLGT